MTDSLVAVFASLTATVGSGTASTSDVSRLFEVKKELLLAEIKNRIRTNPQWSTPSTAPWSSVASQKGTVWIISPLPKTKGDLYVQRVPVRARSSGRDVTVHIKIAPHPFSNGGVRVAYHAQVRHSGTSTWKPYVVKQFIMLHNQKRKEYLDQLETNGVAICLSKMWMKTTKGKAAGKSGKGIKFIESRALELTVTSGGGGGGGASGGIADNWFHMEKVVPGTFEKYTDNDGLCCPKATSRTVLEFSKWSFEHCLTPSRGFRMMVTDLQGGKDSSGWVLTDPAILCSDLSRFGPTNYKPEGLDICYEAVKHTLKTGGALFPGGRPARSSYDPRFSRTGASVEMERRGRELLRILAEKKTSRASAAAAAAAKKKTRDEEEERRGAAAMLSRDLERRSHGWVCEPTSTMCCHGHRADKCGGPDSAFCALTGSPPVEEERPMRRRAAEHRETPLEDIYGPGAYKDEEGRICLPNSLGLPLNLEQANEMYQMYLMHGPRWFEK